MFEINLKKSAFVRVILFFFFILYFTQGWLYDEGSLISKACIVAIVLISGIYFIKTLFLKNNKNLFYYVWILLLLLNITGFFIKFEFTEGPARDMFKNMLVCLLSFFPVYYFTRKNQIESVYLVRFLLVMIPIFILLYFRYENQILSDIESGNDRIVNNIAYSFVGLIPFVYLIKNRSLFSGIVVALLLTFIILSSKRGAIIAGFIGLLIYFRYQLKNDENQVKTVRTLGAIFVISALSALAYKLSVSNELLINRMASILAGDTSGRDIIYKEILANWYNSKSILNLLFGFGFASSLNITGGSFAHNDWLELLSNFGLVGISTYFALFYLAFKSLYNKAFKENERYMFFTIIIIWLFISMVSMWYSSMDGFLQSILLGYLVGKSNSND